MEKKWMPCWCSALLGVLVIVFAWWGVTWAATALTVIGAIQVLHGLSGKCCCRKDEGGAGSCCSGS
jgi:hypothetical protein